MKKKIVSAAVMAALTLSAASVFAAPDFSGDARVDYIKEDGAQRDFTNRIRLNVDDQLGNNLYVHGRMAMNNNVDTGVRSVDVENAYIGGKIDNIDFKAGSQDMFIGKGLLVDSSDGTLNGLQLGTNLDTVKLNGFVGKGAGKNVSTIDASSAVGNVNLGASYLKDGDNKYLAFNGDTKISDNAVLNVEYVKNQDSSANGYSANVAFGKAQNKGDVDYKLIYRDIDAGAVSEYTTDRNDINDIDGYKGFKVNANYKVTNNSNLAVTYDMAKAKSDNSDKKKTEVEYSVNF